MQKNKKSGNQKDLINRSESQNEIEIDFGLEFQYKPAES